jgi:CHAT domain-containing protein
VFIKYGESLMNSYLSEANKLILFRLGAAILFDRSIYFAYEMYKQTKDKQYIEDALFYSERSKSTLLVNALRSKENRSLVNLPEDMLQKEKNYLATLKNFQKKQIEAPTEADKNKIQQDINDLNIQLERFKEELQKKYPSYYQHRYNLTLSNLKAIQAFLGKKDNVMIEYALGMEKHYAFVVTKNSLDMFQLQFSPADMKKHTENMRKTLTDYRFITKNPETADSLFVTSSLFFYNTFLKPILKNVTKGQHLLIIPDQNLGHLPFETFLTAKPTKALDFANYPYLLKDYPVSYSYSATVLLGQARHQEGREIPKEGVLAFAAEYPETPKGQSYSHQRGGDLGTTREGLQPLPGAKEEVQLMSKYLFGEFYHGNTASEETFKKNAQNYGIIHLAMHGVLDSKNPILSSLVFSEDSSKHEDNFLRAYEIAQLDLNADLVVLSACETGYGHFQQGEGVMSLAHSFSYAGASSILMSLWQVNDFSTSQIMKNFYINIAKGWSKERALREAKLTYLGDSNNKAALHPAFWAAFVQTGNIEPLNLIAKSGKSFAEIRMMVIGGVVLLLGAVGFVVVRRMRRNRMA